MIKELFKKGVISAARLKAMQESSELKEVDRHTLCSMVKTITVFEDKRLEIEFYYRNQYRIMQEVNKRIKQGRNKETSYGQGEFADKAKRVCSGAYPSMSKTQDKNKERSA